tara:strand:- start:434 stop:865 length:432 start_codon:yes stop_codon:yes gene_type:complete
MKYTHFTEDDSYKILIESGSTKLREELVKPFKEMLAEVADLVKKGDKKKAAEVRSNILTGRSKMELLRSFYVQGSPAHMLMYIDRFEEASNSSVAFEYMKQDTDEAIEQNQNRKEIVNLFDEALEEVNLILGQASWAIIEGAL